MSVRIHTDQAPPPMEVEGLGVSFLREWRGDGVEIEIEYPDLGSRSGPRTETRYVTISREDWRAIVAHVGDS